MELHYTVVTVLFVILVLVLCFVAISMFIPLYWSSRGSPLFNTTISSTQIPSTSTVSSETSRYTSSLPVTTSTTTTILTSPPPGKLKIDSCHITDRDGVIKVGLVLKNTYPVEVIVDKIYLNDTLVYKGSHIIPPWSEITRVANQDIAKMLVTIWINTRIKPAPGSEIIACGKIVTVGTLTIYYRIPNVEGLYNITLPLKLPECMIKEYTMTP